MNKQEELKLLLKVKGIYITPVEKRTVEDIVCVESPFKREFFNKYPFVEGDLKARDVAIIRILSNKHSIREGVDWDWRVSSDGYHYDVGWSLTKDGKRLHDMVTDYNLVMMRVMMAGEGIDLEELEIRQEMWLK